MPDDVEIRLSNVHLHGVSGGKVVWDMIADDFDMSKTRPLLHIQGLKQVALLNEGKDTLNVSADNVEKNTISGDITLNGNVAVTGDHLLMHTPLVTWQALSGILCLPQQFSAQLGDYALAVSGNTTFNTQTNLLHCVGAVTVMTQGNTIHAGGADVDVARRTFVMHRPVQADFEVADVQEWTMGINRPELPAIPLGVQERYRDYCQQQGLPIPAILPDATHANITTPRGGQR